MMRVEAAERPQHRTAHRAAELAAAGRIRSRRRDAIAIRLIHAGIGGIRDRIGTEGNRADILILENADRIAPAGRAETAVQHARHSRVVVLDQSRIDDRCPCVADGHAGVGRQIEVLAGGQLVRCRIQRRRRG